MSIVTPTMEGMAKIEAIRKYCDYIENHLNNVQKAWVILQDALSNENVVYDDYLFWTINAMISDHDLSKMDSEEFIQYAEWFFGSRGKNYDPSAGSLPCPPTGRSAGEVEQDKNKVAFDLAWDHHKKCNPHHWENWTTIQERFPNEKACHVVCMVADWMAMGMVFGDTAEEFYQRKKDEMQLPAWAVKFLEEIFAALRSKAKDLT